MLRTTIKRLILTGHVALFSVAGINVAHAYSALCPVPSTLNSCADCHDGSPSKSNYNGACDTIAPVPTPSQPSGSGSNNNTSSSSGSGSSSSTSSSQSSKPQGTNTSQTAYAPVSGHRSDGERRRDSEHRRDAERGHKSASRERSRSEGRDD